MDEIKNPYAGERFDSTYSTCKAGLGLLFDGSELKVYNGIRLEASYKAVSGKADSAGKFDYSSLRQKMKSIGPIPAGTYWLNPEEIADLRWRPWVSGAAWGAFRWTIHPFTTNVTHGRGGFFIHGGSTAGSAGCIDLTTNISAFVTKIKGLAGTGRCQIHLTVAYP